MYANRRNFLTKEIGVEEHDGDVRFKSGSGNMAVSCMRNASGIIIGTVRSSWTWLCGKYHVPQNVFLVQYNFVAKLPSFIFIFIHNGSKKQ